jgi:hypothetical protein
MERGMDKEDFVECFITCKIKGEVETIKMW